MEQTTPPRRGSRQMAARMRRRRRQIISTAVSASLVAVVLAVAATLVISSGSGHSANKLGAALAAIPGSAQGKALVELSASTSHCTPPDADPVIGDTLAFVWTNRLHNPRLAPSAIQSYNPIAWPAAGGSTVTWSLAPRQTVKVAIYSIRYRGGRCSAPMAMRLTAGPPYFMGTGKKTIRMIDAGAFAPRGDTIAWAKLVATTGHVG